jgi:hypothetical protein
MRLRRDVLPMIVLVVGLVTVAVGSDKFGLCIAGAAGLLAGGLRLTQPPETIAWLVSRRKPVDVAASLVLGAALCVVALSLPH